MLPPYGPCSKQSSETELALLLLTITTSLGLLVCWCIMFIKFSWKGFCNSRSRTFLRICRCNCRYVLFNLWWGLAKRHLHWESVNIIWAKWNVALVGEMNASAQILKGWGGTVGTGEVEGTKQDSARPVCFLCFLLSPLCHAAPLLCKCTNSPSGPFFSTGPLSGRHGKLKNDSGTPPKSLAAGKRVHKTVSSFSPSCTNPSTVPFTCMPQKQVHVPETNLHCVKRLFLYCFFIFFLPPRW